MSTAVPGGGLLHRGGLGGGGCSAPTSTGILVWRRGRAGECGGGWRLASPGGRRGVLPGQGSAASCGADSGVALPSLVPGQGSTALRGAGHRGAPRRKSDVGWERRPPTWSSLSRSSHLETWTLFLRARCCDTLPTCHATVYGYF